MKNLIVLISIMTALAFNATAQYTSSAEVPYPNKGWAQNSFTMKYYTSGDDTATNTDTIRMGAIMNGKYDVNIKLTYTKVSDTVDGVAYVRSSPDGTNWFTVSEGQTKSYKDTADLADATTTIILSYTADEINGKYVEVYYVQNSTGVSAPVATIYYRKSEE